MGSVNERPHGSRQEHSIVSVIDNGRKDSVFNEIFLKEGRKRLSCSWKQKDMKGVTVFGVGSSNGGRKALRMTCQLGD